jgi:hypothetical protein
LAKASFGLLLDQRRRRLRLMASPTRRVVAGQGMRSALVVERKMGRVAVAGGALRGEVWGILLLLRGTAAGEALQLGGLLLRLRLLLLLLLLMLLLLLLLLLLLRMLLLDLLLLILVLLGAGFVDCRRIT